MKQEPQIILCPYCGHVQTVPENAAVPDRCDECKGLFEPLSRRATQISMGPWYIRDKNNPFRPGCSYEVISRMARNNRIKPTTVLRGPSTKQFWSVARNVPGVAHLLGYCHQCSAKVEPTATACTACNAKFEEPKERNELGLAYRTAQEAASAQRALDKEIAAITGAPSPGGSGISPAIASAPGAGLLDEVLGTKGGGSPLLNFGSGGAAPAKPAVVAPAAAAPGAKPQAAGAGGGAQPNFASGFATGFGAPAAVGGAGAPPARAAVDAFSLGGEADDTGVDDVQRKQKAASTMTWALIGFNALLIVVVIALFLMSKGKSANARNQGDDGPAYAGSTYEESDASSATPDSGASGSTNQTGTRVEPQPMRRFDAVNPDSLKSGVVGGNAGGPVEPRPVVPTIPIDPSLDRDAMNAKMEQATAMIANGDYENALPLMWEIRDQYPKAWHPANLAEQIKIVSTELDRRAQVETDKRLAAEVQVILADAKAAQLKNDHLTTVKLLAQVRDNYPPKFHPTDLAVQIAASLKHVDRNAKDGGKFFGQSTDQ